MSNLIYCRVKLESGGTVTINPTDVAVSCQPATCAEGIGNTVTVRVNGHFTLLTPLMSAFFGGNSNITFGRSSVANIATQPTPPSGGPSPTGPAPSASASASASVEPTSPTCTVPSAGFTYTLTGGGPQNDRAPVTVTVTDKSTSPNCAISSRLWTWGDGTTSLDVTTASHTYVAKNPDKSGFYTITLKVSNAAGSNTSGAVQIAVK